VTQDVREAPGTGDPAVDQALACLVDLDRVPVGEHLAVLTAVHAALQDLLADAEG